MLSGGLRLEHHSLFGNIWIPDAGLVLQPEQRVSLRVRLARGFHSPTVKDLYLPFPAANPDLQPEHLWSLEGGVELRPAQRVRLDLALYRIDGENTIRPVFGPQGPSLVNGGEYASHGLEFSGNAQLLAGLSGSLSYAYFSQPEEAPGTPGHTFGITLSGTQGPFRLAITGSQARDLYGISGQPPRTSRLRDHTTVGFHTGFRPNALVAFHLQVDNVFDRAYETAPGYPMPGVTLRAGLTVGYGTAGR